MTDDMTTGDVPAKVLDRVRKLLAQAEEDGGGTPAERQLAAERAASMMARHGVEQAMLDQHRDPADDPQEHREFLIESGYSKNHFQLFGSIAENMSVRALKIGRGKRLTVHAFGRRSDLERVDFLYTSLLLQAERGARGVRGGSGDARSARTAWLYGFAQAVRERMEEARKDAAQDAGTGAELVLADRHALATREAESYFAERGARIRKPRTNVIRDAQAYAAGQAAGSRADLGNARVGGTRRAITG